MSRLHLSHRARRTLLTALTSALVLAGPAAHAKGGGDDGGGDDSGGGTSATGSYAVTVGGRTYAATDGRSVKLKDLALTGPVVVAGVHTRFRIDPQTLGVLGYTLTGAPSPERMVTQPTVVFAAKTPTSLTAAQLRSPRLAQLEIKDGSLTAIVQVAGGKLKVQAKDAPQGGIFQMEPEFAGPVEITHQLGDGLFYFVNEFTGKINFGDGVDAQPTGATAHQMLLGKDSPQVATKTYQDATTTRWLVQSGGRMGGVLGEDAIELSAGATSCTSQCQAQNRIRGSLPVPPDPTNPTPLG